VGTLRVLRRYGPVNNEGAMGHREREGTIVLRNEVQRSTEALLRER